MEHLKLFTLVLLLAISTHRVCCQQIRQGDSLHKKMAAWSAMAPQALPWADCVAYCDYLKEDGYADWYMPSLGETIELADSKGVPGSSTIWTRTPLGYKNIYDTSSDMNIEAYFTFRLSDRAYFNIKTPVYNNCICVR